MKGAVFYCHLTYPGFNPILVVIIGVKKLEHRVKGNPRALIPLKAKPITEKIVNF